MQKVTILNSKEVKKIREILVRDYDYCLEKDYAYLKNPNGNIFLVNKDLDKINLRNLIVDKIGLYFAEDNNNQFRLSKEGAQLLFNEAKKNKKKLKNVVELDSEEIKKYFHGEELVKDLGSENRFVLLKYASDVFGCAKYKEGKIINFLPKIHRGEVIL